MDGLRRAVVYVTSALAAAVCWMAWAAPASADTIDPPWYDEGSNVALVAIGIALAVSAVVTIVVWRRRRDARRGDGGSTGAERAGDRKPDDTASDDERRGGEMSDAARRDVGMSEERRDERGDDGRRDA